MKGQKNPINKVTRRIPLSVRKRMNGITPKAKAKRKQQREDNIKKYGKPTLTLDESVQDLRERSKLYNAYYLTMRKATLGDRRQRKHAEKHRK